MSDMLSCRKCTIVSWIAEGSMHMILTANIASHIAKCSLLLTIHHVFLTARRDELMNCNHVV
jgi:hypothetical protein